MKQKHLAASIIIFGLCAAAIGGLAYLSVGTGWMSEAGWPFSEKKPQEQHRTRIIIPSADGFDEDSAWNESAAYNDSQILKAPLGNDEIAISVLSIDFNNNATEEQIVAYRSLSNAENPVSIAFFGYDERSRTHRYLWRTPVAATMPGTVSLYTQDLLGDRSFCVIVTGMNEQGEHTMTVFRRDDAQPDSSIPFSKIAEITMDGSITVQETERTLAYQQGIASGQPFAIAAWGRDAESDNMLDRIEISYAYSAARKIYEQSKINRVPGSQIEQRRLREILTGQPKVFEEFIHDLWYHVSPEGIIDRNQYLYFDPVKREIIFYGDETQQVFVWQTSNSTRYGLYISSQNISVTTLRRFLDVELESLDRI
ncbi:MAG: pallilysin-related adhesin, partial [Treponema sp.]|nr:pallilysin-related adhesin [Treponema sp.]